MSRSGALELRDAVLDDGSFSSWDAPPMPVATNDEYRRELADAAARTGLDESVVTGEGRVFGRRVAVVACEFDFLAGSIGVAAAERITAAVRRATAERLPLLASPSSGGTRMQEGTVGSGGPALAMVPADRVLAALHGWLAPLPPEGASAIVYRDVDHAAELAAAQGIRSVDLLRDGIVDVVVPEHPDAADEPVEFTRRLSATIAGELHRLRSIPDGQRLDARLTRYRRIGLPDDYSGASR